MQNLANITLYRVDATQCWTRLKLSRSPEVLNILRCRRRLARSTLTARDLPRQLVLKDDYVVQVAMRMPKTVDELLEIRGHPGMSP